jgi:hypothetical protein
VRIVESEVRIELGGGWIDPLKGIIPPKVVDQREESGEEGGKVRKPSVESPGSNWEAYSDRC